MIAGIIVITLWSIAGIFITGYSIRNHYVFVERMNMNKLIFQQGNYERYMYLKNTIEYDEMLHRFWIWPAHKMWPQELQELRKSNEK